MLLVVMCGGLALSRLQLTEVAHTMIYPLMFAFFFVVLCIFFAIVGAIVGAIAFVARGAKETVTDTVNKARAGPTESP